MITPTAVYLMKNDWSQANYKLGISRHPEIREAEVQDCYSVCTVLLATCWFPTKQQAQRAEAKWHRFLDEYRTDDHSGKEWFSLPTHLVDQFISWCQSASNGDQMKRLFFSVGTSHQSVQDLATRLHRTIPIKKPRPCIDLWRSECYT